MAHALRCQPGHEIAIAAGRDAGKLSVWSQSHNVANVTTDFDAVVDAPDVDVVYIALPPGLHAQWAERAMRAGKRVLCEKPLTDHVDSATALMNVSQQLGVPISHATGFVHHPRSHAMRAIVRSGELGEIRRVTVACSLSSELQTLSLHRIDARLGGGCLLDLGWYCVYATLWFVGLRPVTMQALGSRMKEGQPDSVWRNVQATARLENGAIASWDCGYDAAGRKWMEIAGSRASLICDDFSRPWDLDKPRFWVHGQDGKARSELIGEGLLQESILVHNAAFAPLQASQEAMRMAVDTQSILGAIDSLASAAETAK